MHHLSCGQHLQTGVLHQQALLGVLQHLLHYLYHPVRHGCLYHPCLCCWVLVGLSRPLLLMPLMLLLLVLVLWPLQSCCCVPKGCSCQQSCRGLGPGPAGPHDLFPLQQAVWPQQQNGAQQARCLKLQALQEPLLQVVWRCWAPQALLLLGVSCETQPGWTQQHCQCWRHLQLLHQHRSGCCCCGPSLGRVLGPCHAHEQPPQQYQLPRLEHLGPASLLLLVELGAGLMPVARPDLLQLKQVPSCHPC